MKRIKVCDHCEAKFVNRKSLRLHLLHFHEIDIFVKPTRVKPRREGKALRRIRMIENAARVKKETEVTNRKRIGLTRSGGRPVSELAFMKRVRVEDVDAK